MCQLWDGSNSEARLLYRDHDAICPDPVLEGHNSWERLQESLYSRMVMICQAEVSSRLAPGSASWLQQEPA